MSWLAQADPDVVRRAVQEVLSRPEYAEVSEARSLLDRLVGVILESIGRLLLRLGGSGGASSIWGALGLLILVLVLLGLIIRLLRRFRRGAGLPEIVDGPIGRSPRDWGAEAVAHEAAGRLRDALRCRYRETVALLAGEGLVDEIPGRTTGEYLAAVRSSLPDAGRSFAALTGAFERAWYGGRAVDTQGLAAAQQAQEAVVRAAGLRTSAITTRASVQVPS